MLIYKRYYAARSILYAFNFMVVETRLPGSEFKYISYRS